MYPYSSCYRIGPRYSPDDWQVGGKASIFLCPGSYRLIRPIDPDEEEELRHEEADAQVLVDGVPVTLQPTEEAEGEDAYQETDKRQ